MRIATPTATLGIRGTTGLVEVPEGATATSANVAIKLYPDADGRVGRIEINDRGGAQLGTLTPGASSFAIRPGGSRGPANRSRLFRRAVISTRCPDDPAAHRRHAPDSKAYRGKAQSHHARRSALDNGAPSAKDSRGKVDSGKAPPA